MPWGQGDTPIKAVLKLLEKNKWDMPANVEFEYPGDPVVEVGEVPGLLQGSARDVGRRDWGFGTGDRGSSA